MSFGNERLRVLLGVVGLLLVALSAGLIVAWTVYGGGIRGSVLLPALVGVSLLASIRSGSMELGDDQVLRVMLRRFLLTRRVDVPIAELIGVTVTPISANPSEPEYELRLLLTQGRSASLLRATRAESLERARSIVGAFVLEHDLLQGEVAPPRVRVETTGELLPAQSGPADVDSDVVSEKKSEAAR